MSIIFTEAELGIVIFEAKNLHLRTSQPRREPTYDIWVSDTMQTSKWGGGGNKTISSFLPRVLLLQGRVVPQPSSSVLILKSVSQADGWGAGADPWLVFNSRLFVSRGEESFIWQLLIDTWPTRWPFVETGIIMRTNTQHSVIIGHIQRLLSSINPHPHTQWRPSV